MEDLAKVLAEINKKFGPNTISTVGEMKTLNIERVPSGSIYLDWALGGGWPLGRSIELYGHYSSGKSLIALKTIVEAQDRGLKCIYIDAESSFDPVFAKTLGVDIDKLIISQQSVGENTFDIINALLQSDVGVVVVDSVASLVPQSELEDPMEQQTMALAARLMSKAMRKITALNKKTLILFINQIRMTMAKYGNPETTTGGKALGFYSAARVEVRRGDFIEDNKTKIGQVIKFKISKNKTAPPFREGYFKFLYDSGEIDSVDELVSMGIINKKIEQKGPYYSILGKQFQGREALEKELKDNKTFFEAAKKETLK
jgi:recombination protein RecA